MKRQPGRSGTHSVGRSGYVREAREASVLQASVLQAAVLQAAVLQAAVLQASVRPRCHKPFNDSLVAVNLDFACVPPRVCTAARAPSTRRHVGEINNWMRITHTHSIVVVIITALIHAQPWDDGVAPTRRRTSMSMRRTRFIDHECPPWCLAKTANGWSGNGDQRCPLCLKAFRHSANGDQHCVCARRSERSLYLSNGAPFARGGASRHTLSLSNESTLSRRVRPSPWQGSRGAW